MDRSLPPFLREQLGELLLWQWLGIGVCLVAGLLLGLLLASALHRLLEGIVRRTPVKWDDALANAIDRPTKLWTTLVITWLCIKTLHLPEQSHAVVGQLTRAGVIAATIWGINRSLYAIGHAFADESYARETMDPKRQANARAARTQIILAARVVSVVVLVVGVALVALQFEVVRSVGMSLLASAGVAGVALGFAAQKSLGALLAGIQISISQPIRIGDSVLLQGEFGTIEDIGLTFVTVRLWDERRLIVPTPRFLDEPFQNWSRTHVGLLGTVSLQCDFAVPIDKLRERFEQLMDKEPLWDGRVKKLQVTEAGASAIEVRLLLSARDPGTLGDLRVSVREKLVSWLQDAEHGANLPRTRLVLGQERVSETQHGAAPVSPLSPLRPESVKPIR
ncbi:MAG: putative mechanosensitive channel protein [Myxococcaceae bacterium]|nr:putative mechanosensitive channel protein [Myxococcaceae bacterium]